jgi:DNA-binding CsgD family transcriptional regulator
MLEERISGLIAGIYEAGLDPSRWPDVMDETADLLQAEVTNLGRFNAATCEATNIAPRVAPEYHLTYLNHWASRNPLARPVMATPVASVVTPEAVLPRGALLRAEIFHEWFKPQGMEEMMGSNLGMEGPVVTILGAWRPARQGPFAETERKLLGNLAPHFIRAIAMASRLLQAEFLASNATAALDQLTHGVALLEESGTVRFLNRLASDLLARGDGLRMRQGALIATTSNRSAALQEAIRRAARDRVGSSLQVARASGGRDLTVLVAPLQSESAWLRVPGRGVLLIISDPEQGGTPPKQRLMQRYRLTPAEAALAIELMQGHDVSTAAERLRITFETARTHLRRVFQKTATHRQSELVRLLHREMGAIL